MVNRTLRVLHVEDSGQDVALLTRHLSRAGYELISNRVETFAEMRAALETQEWDVILCDYSMPHFNALSALALLQEMSLDVPFIIISGTIGEALAVEAMRAGANDYLMKDSLVRLAPAIEREMHEAENRRARRRAEAELRHSEAQYRRLIDTAYEGIWIADAKAHITYANQRLAEMLGYTVEEMLGRSAFSVCDDDTRTEMKVKWQRRLQGIGEQYDLRLRRKDGSTLWVILSATPIRDEQGQVTGALAMLTDITQRKRAEQLVHLQATALESADNAILISDHEGGITWVNPAFTTLTGYAAEEVLGQNPRILKSGQHEPAFYESMWQTLVSGQVWHGEVINLRKNGSSYIEEQTITPVLNETGGITNFIAIKQDITERKRAEEEKAQLTEQIGNQRQRLNNIVASVPGVVWEAWGEPDASTQRINFVSDYVETMLGYSVEEWLSTPNFWLSIVHPDDRERTARAAAADFASCKSSSTLEFRWVAKHGRELWVESNSAVTTDNEGRPVGLRGVTIDITERKRAEEMNLRRAAQASLRADINAALAESNTPLRRILERYAEAMVQHLDAAFARIWTLNKEEDVLELQASAGMYTHIDGPHARVPVGAFKIGLIAEERQPHITNELQTDPLVDDKEWAEREGMIAFAGYPLIVEDRLVGVMAMFARQRLADDTLDALASVADIISQGIERKRAEEALHASEEQLRQSQKLEAVGQLAGGVAHDFNNLLTVINGYSDLALKRLQAQDPLRQNLKEIRKAGERAASLTRQLLAFSRKQVLQPKVLNLNSIVSDLEKMLRRLIGEDIELRTVLEPELGSIKADPGQIEQVIMNLVVNARDAMPSGGKLTIETQNVDLDKEYSRQHIAVTSGPYALLSVSDNGCGMNEETQARIFEPFFTTKGVDKGTGLGLSTAYGIVKQSGGNIWIYSEVGQGTTFKVYLPRVDEGPQEYKQSAEGEEALRGKETILLAEDEEMVRKLGREVLKMSGYKVLEAANGGAALLICERHQEPIHLLVTDVIMPEMSGRELADRLAQLRPEMKVLYVSGYTNDAIVHHGVLDSDISFLQKPFTPNALARKVRQVLDATPED